MQEKLPHTDSLQKALKGCNSGRQVQLSVACGRALANFFHPQTDLYQERRPLVSKTARQLLLCVILRPMQYQLAMAAIHGTWRGTAESDGSLRDGCHCASIAPQGPNREWKEAGKYDAGQACELEAKIAKSKTTQLAEDLQETAKVIEQNGGA